MGRRVIGKIAFFGILLFILVGCSDFSENLLAKINESHGITETLWNLEHNTSIHLVNVNGGSDNGLLNRAYSTPPGRTYIKILGNYALITGMGYTDPNYATVLKFDITEFNSMDYVATITPVNPSGWDRRFENSYIRGISGDSSLIQIATSTADGEGDLYVFNYSIANGADAHMYNLHDFIAGTSGLSITQPPVRDYYFTSGFASVYFNSGNYILVDSWEKFSDTIDVPAGYSLTGFKELFSQSEGGYWLKYYLLAMENGSESRLSIVQYKHNIDCSGTGNSLGNYKSITLPEVIKDVDVHKGSNSSDTYIYGLTETKLYSMKAADILNEVSSSALNSTMAAGGEYLDEQDGHIAVISSSEKTVSLYVSDESPVHILHGKTISSDTTRNLLAVAIAPPNIFTVEEEDFVYRIRFHVYDYSSYEE